MADQGAQLCGGTAGPAEDHFDTRRDQVNFSKLKGPT